MRKHLSSHIVSLFLIHLPLLTFGAVIQVPLETGTIQNGMDVAVNGDTVLVAPGTYFENINYNGKNITVASHYILDENTDHILNTIIDGSQPADPNFGSCVMFLNNEDKTAVIQGFTLQGGEGWFVVVNGWDSKEGGGVMLKGASATIKNNLIINNTAIEATGIQIGGGGGISALWDANPTILNNVVMLNRANYGAGIALSHSGGIVRNNIIYMNSDTDYGGGAGLFIIHAGKYKGIFENNTIVGNISESRTGGISASNSRTTTIIKNNIIWANIQRLGSQVEEHTLWNPVPQFINVSFEYNNNGDDYDGIDNFCLYPEFANASFDLNTSSPCIDQGDTSSAYQDNADAFNIDLAGTPSQGTLRNDIGAYGGPGAKPFPEFEYEYIYTPWRESFPAVASNASINKEIEILNLGTSNVKIDSIGFIDKSQFSLNSDLSTEINPMDCYILDITWTPKSEGNLYDTLKIYHSFKNTTNPVCIPLRGKAYASTGIHDKQISDEFHLGQNYPNPFNPSTQIDYSIKEDALTSLTILDVQGRIVKTLVNDFQKAGHYEIVLDGTDLASGVYLYQLQAGEFTDRKKLIVLK